ncbi:MAG: hypothetical protein LBT89_09485 [Planctomycetaceae bacterium]|jgi:hypothetical protein|nr:hypothetical protein [Planctomycetaceae bacterium]
MKRHLFTLFAFLLLFGNAFSADNFAKSFAQPGKEYQPWVYWFWNNSNLTKEGITGDLEAMHRTGIGGVLIMEVNQGAPQGPVDFLGDKWRELYTFMLSEAARLGIEVNMNNDAGWNGSGGKWMKPEDSMQVLTFSAVYLDKAETNVKLPEPPKKMNYYKDIAVLAFPTPDGAEARKSFVPNNHRRDPKVTPIVAQKDITDLTGKMAADGTLDWKVPEGKWTILRIGHTTKGQNVHPAPTSGVGLQCDVLSVKASEIAFEGQIGRLVAENKTNTGQKKTFVATHIDSWEVGSQNWTPLMREEFQKYAGYDIWKFLPVFNGYVVDSPEVTDRFLWDFRRAVAKMCMYNHIETFVKLSHKNGLRFSAEAYDSTPCDFLEYAGLTDEPMGEFWVSSNASWAAREGMRLRDCRGMASAGHVYGKNTIGAEAFTAADQERWLRHPGNIKILGDQIFSEGINRFVFHRYSFQPWNNVAPGMMMGPWGLHYERTNTWWEQSKNYHDYLTRCQYMLRQGNYAADIAYIQNEDSPQRYNDNYSRNAYQWDQVAAHAVYQMTVKDGKFTMPSGAIYSVLVLPDSDRITLKLLKKIDELIKAGGTVVGYKKPVGTFGLDNYPNGDKEVAALADKVWSSVIVGKTPETVLGEKGIKPVFAADKKVNWIYRTTGSKDIFFVANPANAEVLLTAEFRTPGGAPELYYPESGKTVAAPIYDGNKVTLPMRAQESVFVVFAKNAAKSDSITSVLLDGKPLAGLPKTETLDIQIEKALYHDRDATEAVKKIAAGNNTEIPVAEITKAVGDPQYGVVKTLTIDYKIGGKSYSAAAQDNGVVLLSGDTAAGQPNDIAVCPDNGLMFLKSGEYELTFASGKKVTKTFKLAEPVNLNSHWTVTFPVKGNTVTKTFDELSSWSDNADEAVKYFSGTAVYKKTFQQSRNRSQGQKQRTILDLGQIEVVAEVKINGKSVGTFWQTSAKADVTDYLRSGNNTIEISVTNLWVNRLIGDAFLPDVPQRQANGMINAWPQWLLEGKSDTSGRQTFCMWNLWKKEDKPIASGLLGPVKLVSAGR